MAKELKNFINGRWLKAQSKKSFSSVNPANKQLIATVPRSEKADINNAVKAARASYPAWSKTPAPIRGEILFRAVENILKNKKKLGDLVAREMGKVKKEAHGDVQEAIDMGFYMAGEGRRLFGQTVPSELPNKSIRTIRQSVGVFALITPWNFPTAIPAWKIFPALISGNTVVFKPSSYTPACASELIKCFVEAGLPNGVLNLVHGKGNEAGEALLNHKDIDGLSFTGSSAVGKHIAEICAPRLTKHCLEMGGKNVIIVMDDADIDLAVDGAIWAAFGTTGQRCTAASRIVLHQKIYNMFTKKLVDKVKKLKLGYALDKGVDVGPLINEGAVEKTLKYVKIGKEEGAKLLCGGLKARSPKLSKGFFFKPTVFGNVTPKMRIAQEEIFGPVTALIKVRNFNEAIKVANNVNYGLSSAIFTQDINNIERAARDLETGLVYINTSTIGAEIQTPFGGLKDTGNGHREAGGLGGALETYTEMKVISVDYSGNIQKAQGID